MHPAPDKPAIKKKTVMLVGNSLKMLLNFRAALIADLVGRSFQVVVVAPADIDASEQLESLDAIYVPVTLNRSANFLADLGLIISLCRILLAWRPALLISYTIKPNLYALPLCKLLGIKSIGVVTGLGYVFLNDSPTAKLARRLLRNSLKLANHVLFLNVDDQARVCGIAESLRTNSTVLPGEGIDLAHFTHAETPKEPIQFLMIARLLTDKGFHEYVAAAQSIATTYPDVMFQILGPLDTDNPAGITRKQLDNATQSPNIVYLGTSKDPRRHIAQSHCIVLPSYREGISRVLLEAGAMARPSITSDVPGCRDVVIDGQTGLLCKPKDALSLAQCMRDFIEMDHAQRAEMGHMARTRVAKCFSDMAVMATYRKLFEKLCV